MVSSQSFQEKPCDDLAAVTVVAVPQEQRDPLSLPELSKLQACATEAMTITFSLLSVTEKEKQLDNAYSVAMRIKEFCLKMHDMSDVFLIVTAWDENGGVSERSKLLERYMELKEDQVRESVKFYRRHGQDYDLQNLWSQKLLENSCEPNGRIGRVDHADS